MHYLLLGKTYEVFPVHEIFDFSNALMPTVRPLNYEVLCELRKCISSLLDAFILFYMNSTRRFNNK